MRVRHKRMLILITAAVLVVGAVPLLRMQFSGEPTGVEPGSEGGGQSHELLDGMVRLSEGDYETNVYSEEQLEIERAVLEAQTGPPFSGTVNGILIDPSPQGTPCPTDPRPLTSEEIESLHIPTPMNLPPGVVEQFAESGHACEDVPTYIQRRFQLTPYPADVVIIHWLSNTSVRARTWPDQVAAATIQGRPGVTIQPTTPAGAGPSWIAFLDGEGGMWQFGGADIRFDDLLMMAESLPLS